MNKHNWQGVKYVSGKDDWAKFEKNNNAVVNMLYEKEMKLCPAYISKSKSTHKKQITILMIPNKKGWHYLAVKKLPTLLRGITSKNNI